MKKFAIIALFAATMSAQGMGIIRPQTNAPPPSAGTNIPALPPRAELSMSATMTDGTGVGLPFVGSKATGVLILESATKTVSGTLSKLTLPTGMDADVKGSFVASGYFESADHSVVTGRYPVKNGNGWVDVSITRLDASNCSVWVRADVNTQLGPATGVAVGSGVLRASNIPVVTNIPTSGEWIAKELASYSKDYKIKSIVAVPRGVLITTYNRQPDKREYAFIDEYVNGKKTLIWEAVKAKGQAAETIGGGIRVGNIVYFIPEVSKWVLKYDTTTGKVSKGAGLKSEHEFSVEMCAYKGKAVFGGANDGGSNTGVYDASNVAKLFDSPLKGLISALAEHSGRLYWVVAGKGLCREDGWTLKGNLAAVASWQGARYVGSQVDGKIYRVDGDTLVQFHDAKASKINRMIPASDGALLVSASDPDTFLRFTGKGVEQLARHTDQQQSVSGKQFDTFINEGADGTILASRENDGGARAYIFTRKGAVPPVVVPPVQEPPKPEPPKFEVRPINYNDPAHLYKGFTWKPISDSDRKLVVLMPSRFYGNMVSATIGNEVRKPDPEPFSDGRQVYRFGKAGASYGVNINFVVKMKDGKTLTYRIPNGAARTLDVKPTVAQ